MLYSLCVLQRWEACWGLSQALSLTGNQVVLLCNIGCPPISDGSAIYFSEKLEILINRKHGLDHDYSAVAIKFSMSNTREDFCFCIEWTNSGNKKQREATMFCSLVKSKIIVHPSVHNGGSSRTNRCRWDNCNIWLILQFQMKETIKGIKLVSVDQEPEKIKYSHSFMNTGRNP